MLYRVRKQLAEEGFETVLSRNLFTLFAPLGVGATSR